MFPSTRDYLRSPLTLFLCAARARPWLASATSAVVALAAVWVGCRVWIDRQLRLAESDHRIHDHKAGLERVRRVLAIVPANHHAHFLSARLHRALKDYAKAEEHLAVCKTNAGEDFQTEWLLLRAEKGEFPQLEAQLRDKVQEAGFRSPLLMETLVYCLMRESRFPAAEHYLNLWLKADPNNGVAYSWRGGVRAKLGRVGDARKDFTRAVALEPKLWDARFQLANLLLQTMDLGDMPEHLRALQSSGWRPLEVALLTGSYDVSQDRLDAADRLFAEVLQAKPDYALAMYQRGRVAMRRQQFQQAESWFRRSIKQDPQNAIALYSLYLCLQQQAGRDKAAAAELAAYKQLTEQGKHLTTLLGRLEHEPDNADLLVEVGDIYNQLQQTFLAHQFLTRALRVQPNHERARRALMAISRNIKSAPPPTGE